MAWLDLIFNTNTYIGILLIFSNFFSILLLYRYLGKTGLLIHIPISMLIANLQVVKTVEILGFVTALGNAMFGGSFFISDILSEIYGKKSAKEAVFIGFYTLIALSVFMGLALLFEPHSSDTSQEALEFIFTRTPRLMVAGLISFVLSQFHDVWAYHFWKQKMPELRFLFVRNNLSTLLSQILDTALFTYLAFGLEFNFGFFRWEKLYPTEILIEIAVTAYILKFFIAALDTPFLYFAVWMQKKYKL